MAPTSKILREALIVSALLVRTPGAGAEQVDTPPPQGRATPTTQSTSVVKQHATPREQSLRQLRNLNARLHANQAADTQIVDIVTANMTQEQKNLWLKDLFAQVRKDMATKGIRTDQVPIGEIFFNNIGAANTRVIRGVNFDFPLAKHNSVTVNETDVKGLTVRELKSVLAHEASHTQTAVSSADFEILAAGERTADHAAARTYGGHTLASALRKMHDNVAPLSPRLSKKMASYNDTARVRQAYPRDEKLKPADKMTVAHVTTNMTQAQSNVWLENTSQRVQSDMRRKGVNIPSEAKIKVVFDRDTMPYASSFGKNEVTINPQQAERLTVRELQSVLAYGMYAAIQTDPFSDAAAKSGMEAAARTYGGKMFSHALGELHRDGDPHDPLHRRQDEAIRANPRQGIKSQIQTKRSVLIPP
jgi:hypothetical protein